MKTPPEVLSAIYQLLDENTQTKEIEGVYSTTTHLQSEEQADTLVTT